MKLHGDVHRPGDLENRRRDVAVERDLTVRIVVRENEIVLPARRDDAFQILARRNGGSGVIRIVQVDEFGALQYIGRDPVQLELDGIPADVLKRAKLVYLNYPNNPTAAVAPREYLERVIAACRKHDLVLAYDNPYCEITFDGYVAPSIFEIPGAMDVAVEFHSLSKSFCMTGWRLGWAVGRPDRIAALARVKNYVDTGAFLAVQAAGAAVLH